MQVVCTGCGLGLDVPEGVSARECPICRSPLRPAAGEPAGAVPEAPGGESITWNGGSLADLAAALAIPAVAVRVQVFPPEADAPAAGVVDFVAGGIADATAGDITDDDAALTRLRAIAGARFVIEPKLPDPATGSLSSPGAAAGKLEERSLANLMRYCETYVLTCTIEVWRGLENARVEYRRGEIARIVVGDIDAPERLAEVMAWAAGQYRIVLPRFEVPPVPVAVPAPVAVPVAVPVPVSLPAPVEAPPAPPAPTAPAPAPAEIDSKKGHTIFGFPAPFMPPAPATPVDLATQKSNVTMPFGMRAPTKDELERAAPAPALAPAAPAPAQPATVAAAASAPARSTVTDIGRNANPPQPAARHAHRATPSTMPAHTAAERRDAARKAVAPYKHKGGGHAHGPVRREMPFWMWIGLGFLIGLLAVAGYALLSK